MIFLFNSFGYAQISNRKAIDEKKAIPRNQQITAINKTAILCVNQSATPGGDGSKERPFQKINDALAASKGRYQNVIVDIGPGSYRENLEISNNTTLRKSTISGTARGESALVGYVHNNNAVTLQIDGMRIANSDAPGAIVVNNSGAKTVLKNVSVDRANRYGIYQRGGTLTIDAASVTYISPGIIRATDAEINSGSVVSYGTAIYISNATANLSNITLSGNSQGIVAEGNLATIQISNILAERHSVNGFLKSWLGSHIQFGNGFSVVEVRNGANLHMRGANIRNNDFCGISVHDGAKLWASNTIILNTRKVQCPGNVTRGGIGVSAQRAGAYVELRNFEIGYSDLCGLQLVNAKAKCSNGRVHHNPIGVNVQDAPPDFNIADLMDDVTYQDNERNLDSETLPVPGTRGVDD
jgi:hypothetical protein